MRVAGATVIVVGLAIAAILLVAPTQVTVGGTSFNCGAPIARVLSGPPPPNIFSATSGLSSNYRPTQCRSQSRPRVATGVVVGALCLVGGVLMIMVGGRRRTSPSDSAAASPLPTRLLPPPGRWGARGSGTTQRTISTHAYAPHMTKVWIDTDTGTRGTTDHLVIVELDDDDMTVIDELSDVQRKVYGRKYGERL
jgi:hypothetical protein